MWFLHYNHCVSDFRFLVAIQLCKLQESFHDDSSLVFSELFIIFAATSEMTPSRSHARESGSSEGPIRQTWMMPYSRSASRRALRVYSVWQSDRFGKAAWVAAAIVSVLWRKHLRRKRSADQALTTIALVNVNLTAV